MKKNLLDSEEEQGEPKTLFLPFYRILMNKIEGVGELGLRQIVLEKSRPDVEGHDEVDGLQHVISSSRFYCTTEEGEMVVGDWKPSNNSGHESSPTPDNNSSGKDNHSGEVVQQVIQDHFRPSVSLVSSPFFPHLLLSVGDTMFNIWKKTVQGNMESIFSSSSATAATFTSGVWSPSRAGVIFMGKSDGSLDIWDLLDQTHKHSSNVPIASSLALSSLAFWTTTSTSTNLAKRQLLAAGDTDGNLHILEIPRNLSRGPANEVSLMSQAFIAREHAKMTYLAQRMTSLLEDQNTVVDAEVCPASENHAIVQGESTDFLALESAFCADLGLCPTRRQLVDTSD